MLCDHMTVTEDLIRRVELSEAKRLAACAEAAGHEWIEVAGGVAAYCGDKSMMTQCSGVNGDIALNTFEEILMLYRDRAAAFEFKLSVISIEPLREWVVRRAVALPEFETILVRSIESTGGSDVDADIREVAPEDAVAYAKRSAEWFFSGAEPPPGIVEIIGASCVGPAVRTFEGYEDGRAVAGCSVNIAEGVAWLAGAAVSVPYRGKGWQRKLQTFRIELARAAGCDLICQGALPGSVSQQNAQRNGFDVAFTRPTFMVDPA
jgi:hypothetical protein